MTFKILQISTTIRWHPVIYIVSSIVNSHQVRLGEMYVDHAVYNVEHRPNAIRPTTHQKDHLRGKVSP